MATLYLLCGLPGSGKTTLAKRLEAELPALRLSPDDWMRTLYGFDVAGELLDSARDPVETVMWSLAERALQLGVDVVVDFGLWSREERDSFRARAEAIGGRVKVLYCEVTREEQWRRLQLRNRDVFPDNFVATEEDLDRWWELFQPPTADELE